VTSANSGSTWTADTTSGGRDLGFKAYMQTGFASSGTFVSSSKDANPDLLSAAGWGTISWNADTPAGASIQFQAAASNSAAGPFSFVGPDNTAATFFTNGGSLTQFNNNCYLKYQASFTTDSAAATPTLHDVTICFSDTRGTALAVSPATGSYGSTANLSATLTASSTGVSGKTVTFTLIGDSVGSAATDSSGIASLPNVSLAGISAGSYPSGIAATFAGDSGYTASNSTAALAVSLADQTITFDALANKTFGDLDFAVTATTASSLVVSFSATGSCSLTGTTVHLTGGGSCTVTASQAGDSNYNPGSDVPQTFSISKNSQTITFGALTGKAFGDPDFAVGATTSSSLTVTFAAIGNCSVTGSTVHLSGAGPCTITASQAGDSGYGPAPDVPQSFSIANGNQTITFAALSNRSFGDADFAVSAAVSSSLVVTFSATGNCSVAGSIVHLAGAGSCTITASQAGDSNYSRAPDVPQSFTINKAVPVLTLTCAPAGYDTTTHSCTTAAVAGIGNVVVSGVTSFTYNSNSAPPADAGTYFVNAIFTSGDVNYTNAIDSGSLAIAKATPTVTVTCPSGIVFDTNVHTCTSAATGVANAAVSGSSILTYNGGSAPSPGGTYAVISSFTSSDSNYADDTGTGVLTIARAGQTIAFGALARKTFGDPDFLVDATVSSGLTVGFSASGNCNVTGWTVHLISVGSCTVTAFETGNTNYNPAIDVPRSFAINPADDFTIAPTLASVTVAAGHPASVHITMTPTPATTTAMTFTCTGLPAKAHCTFAPNPVPAGSTPVDVVMTITTTAATASAMQLSPVFDATWLGFTGIGMIGVVAIGVRRKSRRKPFFLAVLSLMLVLMFIGCGGRPETPGTPTGTSIITVTGSTTGLAHSTTFTLTVN
jgi:hypothetical protein